MQLKIIPILFALGLVSAASVPTPTTAADPAPLAVVIAEATGVRDISLADLRRIFVGYPAEYRSGKRYLPLNHALGTPDRVLFDRIVLGLAPHEVGLYWVDQKVRGTAQPPRALASAELAVRVVASFPGAITYCSPALVGAGLTTLTIDGKQIADADYPLLH